jgi:hypothetical protein
VRVLIFGTMYIDSHDSHVLVQRWINLHTQLNPTCNFCLIDSDSTLRGPLNLREVEIIQLGDNIGHVARGGQDGWGRAFCHGVSHAIAENYDYVVHIEGDSLCKLDVMKQCENMRLMNTMVAGVPVQGMKRSQNEWLETGLLFMNVKYLDDMKFVDQYAWEENNKKYPHTPEWHVNQIFKDHVSLQNWKVMRDDRKVLTPNSVRSYHWITHAKPEVFNAYSD